MEAALREQQLTRSEYYSFISYSDYPVVVSSQQLHFSNSSWKTSRHIYKEVQFVSEQQTIKSLLVFGLTRPVPNLPM